MIHSLRSSYTVISSGAAIALLVTSCGSYQQASYYDNDGIYAEGSERVVVNRTSEPRQQPRVQQEDGVYGDYFGQKANEIDDIMADEIFTDVDSYYSDTPQDSLSSVESENYITGQNNYEGYAGWGDSGGNVTVNIYDNNWGWGGLNYGWASPWLYGGGYGWGNRNYWGYGGYYNPWWGGYGGYGIGWGWGGYGGYYGYGGWGGYYNSFYCPPYYYNNNIYGGNYAYNRSRRGYFDRSSLNANSFRGRSNLSARSGVASNRYRTNSGRSNIDRNAISSRSSRNYRSGANSGNVVSADAIARNRAYRSARSTRALPNYNNRATRSSQAYGNSSPQRSTYSGRSYSGNRSGGAYRSTTPRSSGYSGSSSRDSGSYRSSGSSAPRSSGYQSSGGSSRSSGSSGYRSAPSSSSSRSSGGNVGSSGSRSSGGGTRSSGGSRGGRNN